MNMGHKSSGWCRVGYTCIVGCVKKLACMSLLLAIGACHEGEGVMWWIGGNMENVMSMRGCFVSRHVTGGQGRYMKVCVKITQ